MSPTTSSTSPKGKTIVPLHDDEPLEELLACPRDRAQQFNVWLDQLRAGDPAFAEVPALPSDTGGER
jgi:hypothetical protein